MNWTPHESAKRFYTDAAAAPEGDVWTVTLDGKPLRTPSKNPFHAPRAIAEAAAAEWEAQRDKIDPFSMPVTRAVNTSIERVAPNRQAVIADTAGFGGTDLLCYRADHPPELIARQATAWDPVLGWAARELGAALITTEGIAPVAQSAEALASLRTAVASYSDLGLTALSELTSLSGSLVLALAVSRGAIAPDEGWAKSRIDEQWQIEQWGADSEASIVAARRRTDFLAAARFDALLQETMASR